MRNDQIASGEQVQYLLRYQKLARKSGPGRQYELVDAERVAVSSKLDEVLYEATIIGDGPGPVEVLKRVAVYPEWEPVQTVTEINEGRR